MLWASLLRHTQRTRPTASGAAPSAAANDLFPDLGILVLILILRYYPKWGCAIYVVVTNRSTGSDESGATRIQSDENLEYLERYEFKQAE